MTTLAKLDEFDGSKPPTQYIIVGCPGTGKSWKLKGYASKSSIPESNIFRVTFHREVGYGDFVGAYKPTPVYIGTHAPVYDTDGEQITGNLSHKIPVVKYAYRAGPLVNALTRAILNPNEDIIIIIEEINRANPSVVFGDMLQLLDRSEKGDSEYKISPSPDLAGHLSEVLKGVEGFNAGADSIQISLPANLFIWGTMNRSDESVSYVDSAFMRRWSIEYMPFDETGMHDETPVAYMDKSIKWGDLRSSINHKLSEMDIDEDKFIGPYFLSKHEFNDKRRLFAKLVMYLWNDVVPMDRKRFFEPGGLSLHYENWMSGNKVFGF